MDRSPAVAEDPRVQQLAAAMRAGLERRHLFGSGSCHFTAAGLLPYADLSNFPAVAKPGPFTGLIRFLRGAVKPLLRPWLAVQTEFNRHTVEALQAVQRELGRLRAQVEELQEQSGGCPPDMQAPLSPQGRGGLVSWSRCLFTHACHRRRHRS